MAGSLFELLFKYRPLLFERGDLAFSAPPAAVLAAGIAVALIAGATYVRARVRGGAGARAGLAAIRLALLALVLGLLSRPVLLIPTVVPQQNYLAVLVDDSRSMRLDDGAARAGFIEETLLDPDSGVRRALESGFRLRFYRFSQDTHRLADDEAPEYGGTRTRLGRALDRVRDELASVPLSGIVLATDGADHAPAELDASLTRLRAAGLPVFAIGVGSEDPSGDVEVVSISAPATVLAGSRTTADVVLEHRGFRGRPITVQVEQDGRLVGSKEVRLGDDGATTVRVEFDAPESGFRSFRFRVPVQEGERIDRNNERDAIVRVRKGPEKVLYFEGEPRHEVAFLRRAVAGDDALQLVVLQRTDEERYLRLGVDSAAELLDGFPRTREALFAYRGLVLGSVEASHFSHEQLAMIAEFVERRGGGLLMLGGRGAFAEGGWAGTPVERVLPVRLDARPADSLFLARTKVSATRAAATHPITRLTGDSITPWGSLPALTVFNRLGSARPGAEALLVGAAPSLGGEQVILAHQRYGRGRAAVFAVQDSWMWRMHADIPLEDRTHQRLWRQLLRWLVAETPDALEPELPAAPVPTGEAVEVRARVEGPAFAGVNGARVLARVTAPSGATAELPLDWSIVRDGEYAGRFRPIETGLHRIAVEAGEEAGGGSGILAAEGVVMAGPSMEEYFGARMRRPVLERIAAETGGRFYAAADVGRLPEDLTYTARGVTVVEEKELWDMPAAFLLILLLLAAEWMLRRRRGLA
ncbi:MAG TPA: glutamine amidotransferase [Longimicrobiales bacterium]|nr:glutamine amidotransferase [Longimicrobiales bacterium]